VPAGIIDEGLADRLVRAPRVRLGSLILPNAALRTPGIPRAHDVVEVQVRLHHLSAKRDRHHGVLTSPRV